MEPSQQTLNRAAVQAVAPALDHLTQERLLGEVWKRPGLDVRVPGHRDHRFQPIVIADSRPS